MIILLRPDAPVLVPVSRRPCMPRRPARSCRFRAGPSVTQSGLDTNGRFSVREWHGGAALEDVVCEEDDLKATVTSKPVCRRETLSPKYCLSLPHPVLQR
jgi:hypothetical protein